jgi:hypothetical protein
MATGGPLPWVQRACDTAYWIFNDELKSFFGDGSGAEKAFT